MKLINISLLLLFIINIYEGNGYTLNYNKLNKKKEKYVQENNSFKLKTRSVVENFILSNDNSEENIDNTIKDLLGYDWKKRDTNYNSKQPILEKRKDIRLASSQNHSGRYCEINYKNPLEGYDGYKISCSGDNVLFVEKANWGRYPGDNKTCRKKGYKEKYYTVKSNEKCVSDVTEKIKELCDDQKYCYLKPNIRSLKNTCNGRIKYLDIKYSCIEKIKREPKFAVVMFIDSKKTKPDTIYNYALEDFKEYTKKFNYNFFVNERLYDSERDIFYMKQYAIIECLTESLRNRENDWIMWVDGDVVLMNKNLELKSFLPPDDDDDKEEVNLLIAKDHNGINAGVFLLRVNPWSLTFMLRAASYSFYNSKTYLRFSDQTAMWKVMTEYNEKRHYLIVPMFWFNSYYSDEYEKIKGNLLTHFPGNKNRANKNFRKLKKQIQEDEGEGWYLNTRTTEEMEKLAYEYYHSHKVNE